MTRTHGTPSAYNHGCRCDECRDRHRRRCAEICQRLQRQPFNDVPHGTTGGYGNYGCRCALCTQANREACAARKARRKAVATDTAREGIDL